MQKLPPYTKLASIYDRLMDHVDYESWSNYVLDLLNSASQGISSMIDLSCGTGSLISHLQSKVNTIYGCDSSKEMIYEAQKKLTMDSASLFVSDISNCAIKDNMFDCALILYDSINYLIDENSLRKSIGEVYRILKAGGFLIFDIVSEKHCIEHYADFHESEYWGEDGYSRHSFFDSDNGFQYNNFRIVLKGKTFIEKHQQKIYDVDYLKSVILEKSFHIVGIYDNFSNLDSDDENGRMHFLCIKA